MIKKITLGITLFFSTLMFASPAYADWYEAGRNEYATYYVDTDRIRKNGGYVYWWQLSNKMEPIESEILSFKTYNQGDCDMFRYKALSWSFHKQPMGEGLGDIESTPDKEWRYPTPNGSGEKILKEVCEYAKYL